MAPKHEFGEDIEGLAAKAIRPPMRLSAEDLVASELASAILSDPLSKVRHVCEALMLLDESERRQAEITEEETEDAKKLYAIAIALANVYIDKVVDSHGQMIERACTIPWTFTKKEAKDWMDWASRSSSTEQLYENTISESDIPLGRIVLTRFLQYAMPKATTLMKKIIMLVSPDSYREALKILRGAKRAKA